MLVMFVFLFSVIMVRLWWLVLCMLVIVMFRCMLGMGSRDCGLGVVRLMGMVVGGVEEG